MNDRNYFEMLIDSNRGMPGTTQVTNNSTIGMLEIAQNANYTTGGMLETTQDAKYFIGGMLTTIPDANYSTELYVLKTILRMIIATPEGCWKLYVEFMKILLLSKTYRRTIEDRHT